jgi:hypothetical protein
MKDMKTDLQKENLSFMSLMFLLSKIGLPSNPVNLEIPSKFQSLPFGKYPQS